MGIAEQLTRIGEMILYLTLAGTLLACAVVLVGTICGFIHEAEDEI